MNTANVRLLIADDHEMIRLGLRTILESDPRIRVDPDYYGSLEAEAAVLRHPAGRSRPRRASIRPSPLKGPDDDPEFLRSLDRAIRGIDAGDDPAGWTGEEPY